MSRAPVLRKLLAVETLYEDEIYMQMGGSRESIHEAIKELLRSGEMQPLYSRSFRSRYRLTTEARARAFTGAPTCMATT